MLTEMVINKSLNAVKDLSKDDIFENIGLTNLGQARVKCALLSLKVPEDGDGYVLRGQRSKLGQGFTKETFCLLDFILVTRKEPWLWISSLAVSHKEFNTHFALLKTQKTIKARSVHLLSPGRSKAPDRVRSMMDGYTIYYRLSSMIDSFRVKRYFCVEDTGRQG